MLAGGAFAAFLSTASGLAMSVTGVIDQELLRPRIARLAGGDVPGIRGFRVAAVLAVVLPYVVEPGDEPSGAGDDGRPGVRRGGSDLRAPAHARRVVAAALDVGGDGRARRRWPRRGRRHRRDHARAADRGVAGALLANPAMWAVPLALATSVIVSFATPSRIPAGTTRTMVRLHTPERVVLARSASATDDHFPARSRNLHLRTPRFRCWGEGPRMGRESWDERRMPVSRRRLAPPRRRRRTGARRRRSAPPRAAPGSAPCRAAPRGS